MSRPALLPLLASVLALASCSKGPDKLAADVQKALDAKDVDALLAQADLTQAPAMAIFTLIDLTNDCSTPMVCTVTTKPADEAWMKEATERLAQQNAEWATKPEGVVLIEGKPDPKRPLEAGEQRSLKSEMPYAKVGDAYKLTLARLTAASLAELKATTPEAAVDKTLSEGIGKPGSSEREMDFKGKATQLPAGGGEAGAAYLANVAKVDAAIKAKDVDALAAATGQWGAVILGAKDYSGKEVPLATRQRKMRAQEVRMVVSAQVLGGYQLEDQAVLIVEGKNAAGNTVRGAEVMELRDGAWEGAGADLIEIPAGA